MLTVMRMSQFWILLELRMMEVVVTTGVFRSAVNLSPPTNDLPAFYGWMPIPSPNHVKALKGNCGLLYIVKNSVDEIRV